MLRRAHWTRPYRNQDWLHRGALAELAEDYDGYLRSAGYKAELVTRCLGAAAHLSHWLSQSHRCVSDIDERLIERFVARHVPVCRCARACMRQDVPLRCALKVLLGWLRHEQIVLPLSTASDTMVPELKAFERYLVGVCGLAPSTRHLYLWHLRDFLNACFGARPPRFSVLTARHVRRFIEQHGTQWQPTSLRSVGVALRSYFRFKALGGAAVDALVAAIPQVPRWRLASLPKTLSGAQIERLLGAFDRTRSTGLRDYAVARCLADLGLRAIEVCRLRLEDVDWSEGTLTILGKGRRVERLPLPSSLGRALAEYLRHGRPTDSSRLLFVRWRAPRAALTPKTIGAALREAARRCGLSEQFAGARQFRHSVASRLLQHGASLKAIADVLRHRSFDTTMIYAKVDLVALKRVALPWPGRLS
jgi:site-specific recombinase XerD